ncbi:MAG: glycosyltransferase family 2 protein [Clostridiales bacterium]|nr:glycosyltransferase family 2 protein [Clostridiales bacterium]
MPGEHPFITIGIASYNYASTLEKAFAHIRKQKFTDYEVLYCDDGSKDDSVEVIRTLIANNPDITIRIMEWENSGVMANKQRILDNARGEYVMLCDADDWMDDDCLEVLAEAAKRSQADRVVSEIKNVDEEGRLLHMQKFSKYPNKWSEELHHGALYRRATLLEHNLRFTNHIPDDFCFITNFNVYAKKTEFVFRSVYNWYIHIDSTSRANLLNSEWKGIKMVENVLKQAQRVKPQIGPLDQLQLQAECIKKYYYYLIQVAAGRSLKEQKTLYQQMRELMRRYEPDYLKNKYIRLWTRGPYMRKLHLEIWLLALSEKLHMTPILLKCVSAVFGDKLL